MQNRNLNIEVLEPLMLMSASGIEVDLVPTDGNDYLVATEVEGFLDGGAGDDILEGAAGSNFLSGGAGDDTLFSLKGDNVLNGGSGNDVAVYTGNRADYEVEDQGFGIFAVRSSDRTDFVTEVETLRFDDGEFNIADLVGAAASGQTSGVQVVEPAPLAPEPVIEIAPVQDPNVASGPAVPETAPVVEATAVLPEALTIAAPDPVAFEYIAGDDGDNTIEGNANSNIIDAGAGDDVVIGAGGDDILNGQDGNDTIYGDDGNGKVFTGETVRETFQWDLAGVGNDKDLNGFTQDTGNVSVTFSVLQETGKAETEFSSDKQNIDGLAVDATSSMDSELKGKGNQADYALDFSDAVNDVSFRINDIDGDGVVRVTAYDADNNPINVDLTGGSKVSLSDTDGVTGNDTADSKGGYLEDNNAAHSVMVKIAGPVSRIVIEHDQDGHLNSGINVTDVTYDAPVFAASTGDIGGNDVIDGGAGDDLLIGGGGNDQIDGGDGNDVIYGDEGNNNGNGAAGETVRESLEWDLAGVGNDKALGSFSQNTGNVDVTFTVLQQTGDAETEFSSDLQKVHGIDADGNPVDAKSSMDSELKGKGNQADYALDFSDAVNDVSFRINDIDGDGVVRVTAYDAGNNPINVNLSGGSKLTLSNTDSVAGNDTADSKGGYKEDNSPAYSVLVDIAGPVSRIVIEHDQNGHQNSGINITDVYFDAPVAGSLTTAGGGVGGDDILNGGAGNDILIGQGGNDTINGGAGDDIIYGDEADTSVLNNGGNNNSGGTGSLKIVGTNGAYNGSVVMQVLDGATGAVKNTVELTNNYDANVGSQFALDLGGNDVVRVGITSPEGTFYSDTANSKASMNADGSVRLSFEDIAGLGDRDFDDVIVEINLSGSGAKLLTASGTFGGVTVAEGLKETGPNLIVNGSFEDTTGTTTTGYGFVGKGAIAGWTDANGSNIDLHNDGRFGIQATDGNNWLDMDASPANNIVGQDVVGLTSGETYRLSFDLGDAATSADNTAADNTVTVMWGGQAIATINPVDGVINNHEFDLVAGAGDGSDRLEFVGGGKADYYGASVDNVQLFATEPVGGTANGNGNAGGDDILTGGEGADKIYGGGGSDTIIGGNDGDFVDGGTEGTDYDVLDLRGVGPFQVVNETIDADGDSTSGTIEFLDGLGNVTGSLGFTEIEEIKADPINDAPDARDDVDTTAEDTAITVNLLANDTDANDDMLTVTAATVPADQGTLVDNGNGRFTFTPNADFNGQATITYSISDGNGGEDSAQHVVSVTAVDDAPVTTDDFASTPEDTPVTIDVLDNDKDPDGQPLIIWAAYVPADQGTVDIVNNELVFTPTPDFTGEATITYTAADPDGNETPGTVIVTVTPVSDAPVTTDDSASTPEDTPVTIDVLDNDKDADGQPLIIWTAYVPSDQGTVDIVNNELLFTPTPDFTGEATITYTAADPDGNETPGTVVVTVTPVSDAPVTADDSASTSEDSPVTIDALDNDIDPDGQALMISGAFVPADQGTVSIVNNELAFTPAPGFVGEATITYTAADPDGNETPGTVVVTVEAAPNAGPYAGDDTVSTPYGTVAYGSVTGNDGDPDGDSLTYSLTSDASNGTLTFNSYGTYTYSPNSGFVGQDTFTYSVSDGNGGTVSATVTVTVEPELIVDPVPVDPGPEPNGGPTAVDDDGSTMEDVKAYGTVAGNDSDPNGDTLTYSLLTGPGNGQVTVYADGSYEYLPSSGFVGQDSFTYQVDDGNGGTDTATVTMTVNPKPIVDPGPVVPVPEPNQLPDAVDDCFETTEDVRAYGSVAGNDSDSNGDTLTYSLKTGPANGMVTLYADGSYIYSPDPDFVGEDSFNYLVHDGKGGTDVATVTVKVNPESIDPAPVDPAPVDPTPVPEPNQGPVAVDDEVTVTEGQPAFGTVADNDSDADGDTLTYSLTTGPVNGQVMLYADGGYKYSPAAGFVGQDSFTYQVDDGNGGTDTATVTMTVEPAAVEYCAVDPAPTNAGPDAVDDVNTTVEDTPVSGSVAGNDSDPDQDSLKYWVETGPSNGSLTFNEDGSYTYSPDPGFVGQDSFTYEANDGNGGSDFATVTITTDPAPNSNPDAVEDYNSTTVNTPVSGKVLCNDVDPDGDALAVRMNTQPANGTVTVTPGGSYTYTPNEGFSGQDTFTYTITDGNGGCDKATVTIEVGGTLVGGEDIVRNTIDATDDEFSTDHNTEVSGNVLANDVDPDGDTLVATEMTDVRTSDGGTVSLFADGSFNYTPADGFTGIDTFVYESSDGNGNVTTATVKITVNAATMLAVTDGYSAETNDTISSNVVINDIGVDSDVQVELVNGPANGTLTLNSDGTFTYLANDGFSGEDTFRYRLVDGSSTSEANVRLVIAEVQYDTTYVGSGQDGLIWGDPHFRGDDGGFYDVTGEAGHVYNLLSDSNLQLNAKFIFWQGVEVDGTVIGELGLTLGNDKLFVDLNGANLNGNNLAVGQTSMGNGTVDYDGTVTTINTGDYLLTLTRQDGLFAVRIKVIDPFSDLVAPHGLWGQTVDGDTAARDGDYYKDNYVYGLQGGGALDKVDSDGNIVRTERGDMSSYALYETADIFSTEALFSEGDQFFRYGARQGTGLNRR